MGIFVIPKMYAPHTKSDNYDIGLISSAFESFDCISP